MEIEFVLKAIIPDEVNDFSTVYLFNKDLKILLPITMSSASALNIIVSKDYKHIPRPTVFNTVKRTFACLNVVALNITIYKYLEEIFYAYLCLKDSECRLLEIDSRVSDALALAMELQIPILVSSEVYKCAGIFVTKELLENSLND